jgi:hypothetical protein
MPFTGNIDLTRKRRVLLAAPLSDLAARLPHSVPELGAIRRSDVMLQPSSRGR